MSLITISSLTHLPREQLADLLLPTSSSPTTPQRIAIVDVRDADHIGGHIKSSIWIPSHTLDERMPELLRTLRDKEKVVFHCMLSQQRGPTAALSYARQRAEMRRREGGEKNVEGGGGAQEGDGEEPVMGDDQEVCVLQGGFSMWQAKYGEDERLTDNYVKDVWDEYM